MKNIKDKLDTPVAILKTIDHRCGILMKNIKDKLGTTVNLLSAIVKIWSLILVISLLFLIPLDMYNQHDGIVVMPFEIGKNEAISGIAIADQLTSELIRIQTIHGINYDGESSYTAHSEKENLCERYLGACKMVIPKMEAIEFSMADIGTIWLGSNSFSLGNLIIAFKHIVPGSKPVTTMRGSLERYGSTIVLVAILEGNDVQSWTVRQPIDDGNEGQLQEMITNLAFMIAHDLPQSNVSAKTWEGLKYHTESIGCYNQYKLTGNSDYLYLAGNYSLNAIRSERNYENTYDLLKILESLMLSIGRQNDAIEYCNKALELDPASAYAWFNKGVILMEQGKHGEAEQTFDEAIRLDPEYADAWYSKGIALSFMGNYTEAIKAFNETIKLDNTSAYAWFNKGVALNNSGHPKEALECYEKASEIKPKYFEAFAAKEALQKKIFVQGS